MTHSLSYIERIKIPIDIGDLTTQFFTKCGTHVATGYERVVIGLRGPYIEFSEKQIVRKNILIPSSETWRISSDIPYYIEYRTCDLCNVKIYFQKRKVDYADYKVEFYYISPFELKTNKLDIIVLPLKNDQEFNSDPFF